MNTKQSLQPNPTIFGIGTVIGLALGLFIGWVLWPVEWEGATLRDLDTGEKAEYIAAVADAFVIYDSPEAAANARRRLAPIDENLADEFTTAIRYFRNSNQPEQNIRISNIRQLANSLGILIPDLQLLPDSGQSQSNAEALIATAPAENAVPADDLNGQSQAAESTASSTTDGFGNSWLRSILWFLAVLLIVGGAIFLLGASGLVNWHHWWEKWRAWVEGNQKIREVDTVDEFEEEDEYSNYDPFDDYGKFDYVDEFEESPPGRAALSRRQSARESDTHSPKTESYSFESEAFDDVADYDEADEANGETYGSWHYPYTVRGTTESNQESDPFDIDESDSELPVRTTARAAAAQETDPPDMFRAADFEEIDADASIPGYTVAYAGHRYADDEADDEAEHFADAHERLDDFEESDEIDDDDVADEPWRVPTVERVLATKPAQPATTTDLHREDEEDEEFAPAAKQAEEQPAQGNSGESERANPSLERTVDTPQRTRQLPNEQVGLSDRAAVQPMRQRSRPTQHSPTTEPSPQFSRPRARYKVIDQHTLQYQLGIYEYDESKPIVDPASGKYIGEFGMGSSVKNALVQGNPEQVAALEVWLFDKTDEQSIGNKTRILLSEYAVDHNLDQALLKERRDDPRPFTAQRGVHFQLESQSLLLDCMIVDVEYMNAGAGKGMFQSIKVDMSVHQKG